MSLLVRSLYQSHAPKENNKYGDFGKDDPHRTFQNPQTPTSHRHTLRKCQFCFILESVQVKEGQGFSEVIWGRSPGGEEKFDQVFKGYFLELAERKGRAFLVVDAGLFWRQEDIACLQRGRVRVGAWGGWVSEKRVGLDKSLTSE